MAQLDETTIAMAMAGVGVLATIGWYALAWYGIRTLQDVRDAVGDDSASAR